MATTKPRSATRVNVTTGAQNVLARRIIEDFCPRFAPGGTVVYLCDTGGTHLHHHPDALARLGITVDQPGKMPDVMVHLADRDWLVIIESATSHGPIGRKRHDELKALLASAKPALVFVTAYPTRRAITKHPTEIAWGTAVWIAEEPDHLIHFNGERFLGPYA